ncbi:MAG: TolC family protein [Candidatus Binatia bacterium]
MKRWKKKLTGAVLLPPVVALFLFSGGSQAAGLSLSMTKVSVGEDGGEAAGKILTLEDAVRIALDNQPRIRAAKERIKAQRAVLGQAMSAYYPTVTFRNTYRTSLASGTTTTSQQAFDFFSSAASFDMTLYDFGRREGTVQEARGTLDSQRYAAKTSIDEVILAVKQAYFNYLQAKALVKVREETVRDRELLVRQAKGFFEVGTRPKIDVARAESNLFGAKADLIAAENGVKVAWVELKNAMGVRDFAERPLAEELAIRKSVVSLEEAHKIALTSRPELKDLEAQRRAQDADIAVARRGHLPDIRFNGQYGRRNTSRGGNTFPLRVVWQAGVTIEIPIFTGFKTTYEVEEALRNYHEIKAREEQTRQRIALEVEQSYLKLVEAGERIKAREAAVRAAKENLDLANGRYQVGVGSIIEITEAQTLYTDAQTSHIQSIYDYKIAEAELAKAMGQGERAVP